MQISQLTGAFKKLAMPAILTLGLGATAYGQTDKPADKSVLQKSPTTVSQTFKKTSHKNGDEKQKVRYDRIKNLRERSDYIGSLQDEADKLSKSGKVVGIMIATDEAQEKAYSAKKYKKAVEDRFAAAGVKAKVLIAPNNAVLGSMFDMFIGGERYSGGSLSKLKKALIDNAVGAQKSVGAENDKSRTAIGGLNFTNN